MTRVGRLWRTLNRRVGKVQQAIVLGLLATAIAVPLAVAGPEGNVVSMAVEQSSGACPNGPVTSTTNSTSVVDTLCAGSSFTISPSTIPSTLAVGPHDATAVGINGQVLSGRVTIGPNGSVTSTLAGVPLTKLTISLALAATVTAPGQVPAQVPTGVVGQLPVAVPGRLPVSLPSTGGGGTA
jgi:hypothetical protein